MNILSVLFPTIIHCFKEMNGAVRERPLWFFVCLFDYFVFSFFLKKGGGGSKADISEMRFN